MAVDSGSYTPETIARRQKIAEMLLGQSMKPQKIEHWAQGLAQMANAGVGGYMAHQADQEDKGYRREAAEWSAGTLPGSPASASPPAAMPPASPTPALGSPVSSTSDKIYSPDEPSPLDPPSGKDRDIAIRTMYGEDPGESALGVANVLRNRAVAGKYGGDTPSAVALAKGQFEPWSNPAARNRMGSLDPNSETYQRLGGVLDQAYRGDSDPTGGATHFFAPKAQAALGREVPSWAKGPSVTMGPHAFFSPDAKPANPVADALNAPPQPTGALALNGEPAATQPYPFGPPPSASPTPAAPMAPATAANPMLDKIREGLKSPNPYIQRAAQGMANKLIEQQLAAGKPTDDISEYEYAKKQGFTGSLEQWMQRKRSGAGEYGMQPIWGVDKDGNTAVMQLGKSGEAVQSKVPEGFKISRDPVKVEGPTGTTLLDPQTRQPIGFIPKDVAGAASAKEEGEARGKTSVALPAAENTSKRALKMLDELENHPGLGESVGFVLGRLPALTPKAADFRERAEQIDAMVFGDAVEVMRGLGALTDREGPKITAARARLKAAKSEDDYRAALKDLREVFQSGIENMRTKAGKSTPEPAPAAKDDPLGIR